ncbi:extensin [Rhizobiaceae bacterium CRRU44]|uniref:Extensin n=1 Tax=Ferranicluibacter rubi TaxID=2715133 RepID=A0AA44CCE8_9HYPH|nr:extensin family protein [Ferranicluibacter rubi]NHT76371.1 extensin [Ferranicluibacter rubi]
MRRRLPLLFPLMVLPAVFILAGAGLPEAGPVPDAKPATVETQTGPVTEKAKELEATSTDGQPVEPAAAEDVPKPETKPVPPATDATPEEPEAGKPESGTKKPAEPDAAKQDTKSDAPASGEAAPADKPAEPKPTTPAAELVITPEEPAAYAQCLTDLKALGATFSEKPRIDDGQGCGIDKPISVSEILPGIKLAPDATLRCEAALELARWTKEAVLPAARVAMSEDGALKSINQASSYICRLRNNASTGKISEHARGNAIDIASFTFRNGETIAIQPRDEDGTLSGAFQRAVTATGCLYFETVLDPGSDEAHENHLHFDVLQRRGNYRYCR